MSSSIDIVPPSSARLKVPDSALFEDDQESELIAEENNHPFEVETPDMETPGGTTEPLHVMSYSVHAIQGRRDTMEDAHSLIEHPSMNIAANCSDGVKRSFFAVYDGHGGSVCADFCKQKIYKNIINSQFFTVNSRCSFIEACEKTDLEFYDISLNSKECALAGSTAIMAFIEGSTLTIANIGDSRAVLCSAGVAINLSSDHKPDRIDEFERIKNLGGIVAKSPDEALYLSLNSFHRYCLAACFCAEAPVRAEGPSRVFPGGIAVSRAIGDWELKQHKLLISEPEIEIRELNSKDEFLILACDGLWDVLSSQDAVDIVLGSKTEKEASKKLCSSAFEGGSTDNISALVVFFQKPFSVNTTERTPKSTGFGFTKKKTTLFGL